LFPQLTVPASRGFGIGGPETYAWAGLRDEDHPARVISLPRFEALFGYDVARSKSGDDQAVDHLAPVAMTFQRT